MSVVIPSRLDFERARWEMALDPCEMFSALGTNPDPAQKEILRSRNSSTILRTSRQWGKSTITAAKALHVALFEPESLVLIASPSMRQSILLFRKIKRAYRILRPILGLAAHHEDVKNIKRMKEDPLDVQQESVLSMILHNGSELHALPDNPDTIRGFTSPRLIVLDEAAMSSDELHDAITPMLLNSPHGEDWYLSTPKGKRGRFYEMCIDTSGAYKQYVIPITENPRMTPERIAWARKKAKTQRIFDQEYMVKFVDSEGAVFREEDIQAAFTDEVSEPPL